MRLASLLVVAGAGLWAGPATESVQDLVARLTPEQKVLWDQGMKAFSAQQYADALKTYEQLLGQLPGDAILAKFASEAALNSGDSAFALTTLKPMAAADANDWQSISLLARACAEAGDAACRDANLAHLIELHQKGVAPAGMRQFVLERVKVGENTLFILPSLEPVGVYKIYDLGRVVDASGKIFLRITIESSDGDQPLFAQEHPKEAERGMRAFTLDAYRESGLNSNGQRTQTHFTYQFYVGQPSYEDVRKAFLDIANGKAKPVSSRTGLVVQ